MRKALWSTAALVALLFGASVTWGIDAQAATSNVTMGSDDQPNAFKFFPAEVTIPVGSTVQWENKSGIPHDAVAEGVFDSQQMQKGDKFEFKFDTPGTFKYICTEPGHEGAGMTGVITVTGGSTPAPPAGGTTATSATTATTAAAGQSTTTTSKASANQSTTTTTATGSTVTTAPSASTPTSAPEAAGVSSTTAPAAAGGEESAAGDHGSEGGQEKKADGTKNSPIGIAFAAVSTLLLAAVSGKLLSSKS